MSGVKYLPTIDWFEWVRLSKQEFNNGCFIEGSVFAGYGPNERGIFKTGFGCHRTSLYVGKVRPHYWNDDLIVPAKISFDMKKVHFAYDGLEWDAFALPSPVEVWVLTCPLSSCIAFQYSSYNLIRHDGPVLASYPELTSLQEAPLDDNEVISRYLYWVDPTKLGKKFRPVVISQDPFMKAPFYMGRTSQVYEYYADHHNPGRVILQGIDEPLPRTEGIYIGKHRQEEFLVDSEDYEVLAVGPDRAATGIRKFLRNFLKKP